MAHRGTALAVHNETWPEYLLRVTDGVPRRDVARAADIDPSGVSRWITGTTSRPRAEKVVAFARGLKLNPVEALIAAGYLDAAEVDGTVEVVRTRSDLSNEELLAEVANRLGALSAGHILTGDEQQLPPGRTRIIRKAAAGQDPSVRRDQQGG